TYADDRWTKSNAIYSVSGILSPRALQFAPIPCRDEWLLLGADRTTGVWSQRYTAGGELLAENLDDFGEIWMLLDLRAKNTRCEASRPIEMALACSTTIGNSPESLRAHMRRWNVDRATGTFSREPADVRLGAAPFTDVRLASTGGQWF